MTDAVVRAGYLGGPRGRCVRIGSQDDGSDGWNRSVVRRWGSLCEDGLARWACDGGNRCVGGCGVRCVRIGSHSDWVHDLPLAVSGRAACPVRRQSRALPVSSASNPTPLCRTPALPHSALPHTALPRLALPNPAIRSHFSRRQTHISPAAIMESCLSRFQAACPHVPSSTPSAFSRWRNLKLSASVCARCAW